MFCQDFIKPSMIHESLLLGYLWSNPKLFKKYKDYEITDFNETTNSGTITTPMWYFYYKLGEQMVDAGIQKFNDTTVYSFISSQPDIDDSSWSRKYKKFGGFQTINAVMEECKKDDNNEFYHISEIQKYELLRYYESNGLLDPEYEITRKGKAFKNKDMFSKMTLEKVKSYFQFYMKKGSQTVGTNNIKISNLSDGIDESVDKFNQGMTMGVELFDSPRLNSVIKGWQMGNFIFLVLASGVGKSTFTDAKFDLGIYHSNEKCTHFVNEENKNRAHHTFMSTISSSITKDPITRDRLSEGSFSKEEWIKINKAKEWLKSKPPEQIKFAEIQRFYVNDFTDTVELHKSLGYNYAILDTFKPDSSKVEMARWEKFGQHSQDIFDCIKPTANNVGCVCTLQLKIGSEHKYLDLDCIGKAKEPVEVADIVLMGRLLFEDEYESLAVYDYKESPELGWHKEQVYLNRDEEYMILFIPKNRNGSKSQQIVYRVDYDVNSWEEIGYCNMKKTSR